MSTDSPSHEFTDQNFQEEVINFPAVVLVDFWAPWCGPCKVMNPRIEELRAKYLNDANVKIGQLNVDENNETSFKYKVLSIPTFKVFVAGKLFDEVVGAVPINHIEDMISAGLKTIPAPSASPQSA
jgi:thioredoxin 1